MPIAKRHRIVHAAWARHLDARLAASSLQAAENEGWPPVDATAPPLSHAASGEPAVDRFGHAPAAP